MKPSKRLIYLLSPREFSPEIIAVAFAKTSRSPESFRQIAEELNETTSSRFHEKWVVGYGHASVAEHAVLHLALEHVSRLAVETIESNRLASYTEKSTRYQKWDAQNFFTPPEIEASPYLQLYRETMDALFSTYLEIQGPTRALVQQRYPQRTEETALQWEARIRSHYIDCCRFLLPAASLANVGMTINARMLEHAVCKMLSHPLQEVREIGEEVRLTALPEVPTLLKYTEPTQYLCTLREPLPHAPLPGQASADEMVRLLAWESASEDRVLAAALYEHSGQPYPDVLQHVERLPGEAKAEIAEKLLGARGRFDAPPRAVEHSTYTFEAVMDQGAYFEIKRHRIMTQTVQPLGVAGGYAVPRLISDAGVERSYRRAMEQAAEAVRQIAPWNPDAAGYLVPNGFNRRGLMTLNLRELYHLCELRAAPNAHFSVRRIAYRMVELVQQVHPLLAGYLRLPGGESWQSVTEQYFTDTGLA